VFFNLLAAMAVLSGPTGFALRHRFGELLFSIGKLV
jgi:hypothetical protein